MGSSRDCRSPSFDEFLTATIGEHNPASAAAFAAAILREHNPNALRDARGRGTARGSYDDWLNAILYGVPEPSHAFADSILREYDPGQRRDDWGRWTTGASDEKSPDERRQELLKALAPKVPTPADDSAAKADDNSVIFGKRTFTSNDGGTVDARFAGFDENGQVLLKRATDGKAFAVPLDRFSEKDRQYLAKLHQDEGFLAGLKAKPDNIHLDATFVPGAGQLSWEAQVMRDIAMLSELESGRAVLKSAERQGKEITIAKSDRDNHAQGGTVYFDPARTTGARTKSANNERPPFIGLGQELFNAVANLSRETSSRAQKEENGLRFGQRLRVEYNETIDDPARLEKLRGRYSAGTPYAGWGTKKVDEDVLGLDGRPLPRTRRDR